MARRVPTLCAHLMLAWLIHVSVGQVAPCRVHLPCGEESSWMNPPAPSQPPPPPPRAGWAWPRPYLGAETGTVSADPQELKAEDGHDVTRGGGPERGPAPLQQLSQEDAGQGCTEDGEGEVTERPTGVKRGLGLRRDRDSGGLCTLREAPRPILHPDP